MPTFADRLNEALGYRKMAAAELARELNVADATISNYKKGIYAPKQRRTEEISRILNVSVDWLLGADVPMSRQSVTTDVPSALSLNHHEVAVITAYRNKLELQAAVDKLLDVAEESNIVNIKFAARTGAKKKYLTSDELAAASDDSNLTDEDL